MNGALNSNFNSERERVKLCSLPSCLSDTALRTFTQRFDPMCIPGSGLPNWVATS